MDRATATRTVVLGLIFVWLSPTLAGAQSPAVLYASGSAALAQERYDDALVDCTSAAELLRAGLPEQRGRALVCVAESAAGLGRTATALEAASQAVQLVDASGSRERRYRRSRARAQEIVQALSGSVATVVVYVTPEPEGCTVRAGPRSGACSRGGFAIPADPGTVDIRVEAPGHAPEVARRDVGTGDRVEVRFALVSNRERVTVDAERPSDPHEDVPQEPLRFWIGVSLGWSASAGEDGLGDGSDFYQAWDGPTLGGSAALDVPVTPMIWFRSGLAYRVALGPSEFWYCDTCGPDPSHWVLHHVLLEAGVHGRFDSGVHLGGAAVLGYETGSLTADDTMVMDEHTSDGAVYGASVGGGLLLGQTQSVDVGAAVTVLVGAGVGEAPLRWQVTATLAYAP